MELAKVWMPQTPRRGIGSAVGDEVAVSAAFDQFLSSLLGLNRAPACEADSEAPVAAAESGEPEGWSDEAPQVGPGEASPAVNVFAAVLPPIHPFIPAASDLGGPDHEDAPSLRNVSFRSSDSTSRPVNSARFANFVPWRHPARAGVESSGQEQHLGEPSAPDRGDPIAAQEDAPAGHPGRGSVAPAGDDAADRLKPSEALRFEAPVAVGAFVGPRGREEGTGVGGGAGQPRARTEEAPTPARTHVDEGLAAAGEWVAEKELPSLRVGGEPRTRVDSGAATSHRAASHPLASGASESGTTGRPEGHLIKVVADIAREGNVAQAGKDIPPDEKQARDVSPITPDRSEPIAAAPAAAGGPDPGLEASSTVSMLARRPGAERLWGYWVRRGGPVRGPDAGAAPTRAGSAAARLSSPERDGRLRFPATASTEEFRLTEVEEQIAGDLPAMPAERSAAVQGEARYEAVRSGVSGAPLDGAVRTLVAEASAGSRPSPYAAMPDAPSQQVVHVIRLSLSREGDRITVQLEPEKLGRVQLVVVRDGSELTAHFRVETPDAHHALAAEAPALRQALEAKGMVLGHVSVDLEGSGGGKGERPGHGRRALKRGGAPSVEQIDPRPPQAVGRGPWGFDTRA